MTEHLGPARRLAGEPMLDWVYRWCHALSNHVRAERNLLMPDLKHYAMVLSPEEYAEFCAELCRVSIDTRTGQPSSRLRHVRIFGIAIVEGFLEP